MAKAEITIRGRDYSVACAPGQEQRLVSLSKDLDRRVRAIAEAVGDIGESRLLLISALALLDELEAARQGESASEAGAAGDGQRAASALADAAARIEALAKRIEGGQ